MSQEAHYPTRLQGGRVSAEESSIDCPIESLAGIDVTSWMLPHVDIFDLLGLSDYMIARASTLGKRLFVHEHRWAPAGYLEFYPANVEIPGHEPWVAATDLDT